MQRDTGGSERSERQVLVVRRGDEEVQRVLIDRSNATTNRVPSVCGGDGVRGKENRSRDDRHPGADQGRRKKRVVRRFRNWCFTCNNPEEESKFHLAKTEGVKAFEDVRYIVFQLEQGADGTPHYQGYVEFQRPYDLAGVKSRCCERSHWENRKGTAKQAIKYASKAETRIDGPWEDGVKTQQGSRSDIVALREAIKKGATKEVLMEDHPDVMARYPRFVGQVKDAYFANGWRETECILLIGDTGLGKTRWVYDNWPTFWRLPAVTTSMWFDGYQGETHVLLDDFSGAASKVSVAMLLQILDGYTQRMPNKGGFVTWKPSHMAVTTNLHPRLWYRWTDRPQQYLALTRRFSLVKEFVCIDGVTEVNEYTPAAFFLM